MVNKILYWYEFICVFVKPISRWNSYLFRWKKSKRRQSLYGEYDNLFKCSLSLLHTPNTYEIDGGNFLFAFFCNFSLNNAISFWPFVLIGKRNRSKWECLRNNNNFFLLFFILLWMELNLLIFQWKWIAFRFSFILIFRLFCRFQIGKFQNPNNEKKPARYRKSINVDVMCKRK